MSANYLVIACPVCEKFMCAEHPPESGTFAVTWTKTTPESIRTYTGEPGPAYTFTAAELGLPEKPQK